MSQQDPFDKPFDASVSFVIQGVHLKLSSNDGELVDYVPEHVHPYTLPPLPSRTETPQIEVNVLWLSEDEFDKEVHRFPGIERLDKLGKRSRGCGNELVCLEFVNVKRLQMRFRLDGERLIIDAIQRHTASRKSEKKRASYLLKEFFRGMMHFVYYPVAWHLEHFRGLSLLHASAVEIDGRAVVIAGVGGVGKSTTSVALLAKAGANFISESLVAHDGTHAYGLYEPIRMGDESLELLGSTNGFLCETRIDGSAKKKNLFHVDPSHLVTRAPVGAVFIPSFPADATGGVSPVPPDTCVDRILSINGQSRKITDYYWFASALGLLWPSPGCGAARVTQLQSLLEHSRTFELRIDKTAGLDAVVDAIVNHSR
ncbi:MAG: hypothetical protein HRU01_04985 [Myxococcales bacterium]|nr:hypothetical protein [Myxococcales bacterium]